MNILLDVARVLPTQKTPHREFHTENWWVYGPRSLLVHWDCLSSHMGTDMAYKGTGCMTGHKSPPSFITHKVLTG